MSGELYLAGHSLGAADAFLYAYSRAMRGLRVDGIFALAAPRPGDGAIAAGLRAFVPTIRSLKNDFDGVTDVPLGERWAQLDYCDAHAFEMIHEEPSALALLEDPLFAHHHIDLYLAGARKLAQGDMALSLADAAQEIARLYDDASGWDWINPVDGLYWAMKRFPNGARLLIRRGSKTGKDWLTEDFDFAQEPFFDARVSKGFKAGFYPIEPALDAVLA